MWEFLNKYEEIFLLQGEQGELKLQQLRDSPERGGPMPGVTPITHLVQALAEDNMGRPDVTTGVRNRLPT